MRQTFFQSTLLLTMMALLLGSCADKEDVLRMDDSDVLKFNASVGRSGITRGTLDGNFDGAEQIAITMRVADANANGWPAARRYQAESSGEESTSMLSHSPLAANDANDVPWRWPKSADAIEVKGWHTADQYRTAVDGQEFSVPLDQHLRSIIQGYDFLFAPATTFNDRTASSVSMGLWHQMSLVRIYVTNRQPFTQDVLSSVRMFGPEWSQSATYTEPTGNAVFGSWTPGTTFTGSVTPLYSAITSDGKTVFFEAMIVPQQTRGRQLISFVQDNTTYTYTLPDTQDASPDYMPGVIYTYELELGQHLTVTTSLWDEDPLTPFSTPTDLWENGGISITNVDVNPWLPGTFRGDVDFWIVNWLSEEPTALMDYINLRKATDKDTIPVQTTDTLRYADGVFYYSHGMSTGNYSFLNTDPPSSMGPGTSSYSDRTEGYIQWALREWELNQASGLPTKNKATLGPWAFRVDYNARLRGKTINVLRLKSASTGAKTIKIFVKKRNTAFSTSESPAATATFTAKYVGEEIIAKLSTPLVLANLEYIVIEAPDNTFYLDDDYREMFYCHANTAHWCDYGSSLGMDVGYLSGPVTDDEGIWYITSCKDRSVSELTDSREAAASPFAGYVYPLTMQARLRGYSFNAFRFRRKSYGSFEVYAVKRGSNNSDDRRLLGTVTVSSTDPGEDTSNDKLLVTRYLKDDQDNIVNAQLAADEYLVIGGGLSNWYSAAGGTFSDYNAASYYRYGPEGYYTIDDNSKWSTWTWGGADNTQYGLLGVDVGYVNPN